MRLQSAAAHRLHPDESEVAALVRRRVAAELGGPQAEELAEAIIEVRCHLIEAGRPVGRRVLAALLPGRQQQARRCSRATLAARGAWHDAPARCTLLQAAEARAVRQPLDKRPHTVEEVLAAGGGPAGLGSRAAAAPCQQHAWAATSEGHCSPRHSTSMP